MALANIQKLYALESRLKLASVEERWSERQSRAKPMLDDLYDWLTTQKIIESSPLGKAIKYTLGQWPKLIRYAEDGHLSIDNNRAERAIKSLVIGRKNSYDLFQVFRQNLSLLCETRHAFNVRIA